MSAAVSVRGLEVRYGEAVALTGVDLELAPGSSLAVIGPNGSGKSTLLAALAGLVAPAAGSVRVGGSKPALVLQSTEVDRSLPITVADTVAMARYPRLGLFRRFRADDRRAVEQALDRLGVADLARRQLNELSGGQRQRVLVAQGLAQESETLLLDEPMTGLDLTSRQLILALIDDEVAAGRVVVVTTHDLEDARRCDQVLLVDRAPVAVGPPEQVLDEKHLHRAFGGRFVKVGDELVLDDPHHEH